MASRQFLRSCWMVSLFVCLGVFHASAMTSNDMMVRSNLEIELEGKGKGKRKKNEKDKEKEKEKDEAKEKDKDKEKEGTTTAPPPAAPTSNGACECKPCGLQIAVETGICAKATPSCNATTAVVNNGVPGCFSTGLYACNCSTKVEIIPTCQCIPCNSMTPREYTNGTCPPPTATCNANTDLDTAGCYSSSPTGCNCGTGLTVTLAPTPAPTLKPTMLPTWLPTPYPTMAPTSDKKPLFAFFSDLPQDRTVCADEASLEILTSAGYRQTKQEGYVFKAQDNTSSEMIPLISYYNDALRDRWACASEASKSEALSKGYMQERIEGYIWKNLVKGSAPLFSYSAGQGKEDMWALSSTEMKQQAVAQGYELKRIEGYIMTSDELSTEQ